MAKKGSSKSKPGQPTIDNRKARHNFAILDTLECGLKLTGTEVKSIRAGQASLGEGYVRAEEKPLRLTLHGVHIAEFPPAGPARQHAPTRVRVLLAQKREILKLLVKTRQKGFTIVPLKIYFLRGKAKLLIGLATGKRQSDKRQDLAAKDAKRDMDRAMSKRR